MSGKADKGENMNAGLSAENSAGKRDCFARSDSAARKLAEQESANRDFESRDFDGHDFVERVLIENGLELPVPVESNSTVKSETVKSETVKSETAEPEATESQTAEQAAQSGTESGSEAGAAARPDSVSGASGRAPRLRFAGFTEPWQTKKLCDVAEVTMGQSPKGSTYSKTPSDYILVQGNADMKDGWVYPRVWTTQKTKTACVGDLIMSVRAPVGAVGRTAYDVVLGRGVAGIKGNDFLYHLLSKADSEGYWSKYSAGTTFESINSNVLINAEFMMPSVGEQRQIGMFFSGLDRIISVQERKTEALRQAKKYYLQNMFA